MRAGAHASSMVHQDRVKLSQHMLLRDVVVACTREDLAALGHRSCIEDGDFARRGLVGEHDEELADHHILVILADLQHPDEIRDLALRQRHDVPAESFARQGRHDRKVSRLHGLLVGRVQEFAHGRGELLLTHRPAKQANVGCFARRCRRLGSGRPCVLLLNGVQLQGVSSSHCRRRHREARAARGQCANDGEGPDESEAERGATERGHLRGRFRADRRLSLLDVGGCAVAVHCSETVGVAMSARGQTQNPCRVRSV
mmetsp:Transcript_40774/g.81039  ORF Transcript_40774/g.81039 Transcript_40774/m.81039 type:complete len:257 (+) Transcript_40774:237-1007(+)